MTILYEPVATAPNGLLDTIRVAAERWRQRRKERAAEWETVVMFESLDREMLKDIGATSYLAYKDARSMARGQTVVGPLLVAYLPHWGRDAANEDRARRR
jgi:hypothetical protein